MDDKEKKKTDQETAPDLHLKFTRRDFLRGMGTGAIAASIDTVESPFARSRSLETPKARCRRV